MILSSPIDFKYLKLNNNNELINNINKYITLVYAYIREKEKIKIKPFEENGIKLNPVILYGLSDIEKDIPNFNYPLINLANKWIALDIRQFVRLSSDKENYEIKNNSEYELALNRFILSGIWFVGKHSKLYSFKLPHIAFGEWLSSNLVRKFGLDINTSLKLKILGFIYYTRLFSNERDNTEELNKLIIRLKDDIVVSKLIEEVYGKIEKLENIDDFCENCYKVTDNIRLKNLDTVVLINTLQNNWFGVNAKDLIMLALEHPPTWISMVYMALIDRLYSKNFVGNIVEKISKRGKGDEFINLIKELKQEYIA